MTQHRFAVYFAPDPDSDLWDLGSRCLGRDAASDRKLTRGGGSEIREPGLDEMTAAPAHYGFHATLKPPFHLAPGQTPERLLAFASAFANRQAPVLLPGLQVSVAGDFAALIPTGEPGPIGRLATACVEAFDVFRAPPEPAELARRSARDLTPRQTELLHRWGYPYLMDEFRFHLTLTGPLDVPDRGRVCAMASAYFAAIVARPCPVDSISIFAQKNAESPFYQVDRFRFAPKSGK